MFIPLTKFSSCAAVCCRFAALLASLMLLLGSTAVQAYQPVRLCLEDLIGRAEWVAHAKVLTKECQMDHRGQIYTRVDLQLIAVWKGSFPSNHCEVVLGGGVLGDRATRVSGQVQYVIGEEVVVFLKRGEGGDVLTVGMAQGKLPVLRKSLAGSAVPRSSGATTWVPLRHPEIRSAGEWAEWSLEGLKSRVTELARPLDKNKVLP